VPGDREEDAEGHAASNRKVQDCPSPTPEGEGGKVRSRALDKQRGSPMGYFATALDMLSLFVQFL